MDPTALSSVKRPQAVIRARRLQWRPASGTPPLESGLHLWRIDRDRPPRAEFLTSAERERAARLRPSLRPRFLAVRCAVRLILADYVGREPGDLEFATGPHGKPYLRAPGAPEFNLTDCGPLALLAVARNDPVGVDLERVREVRYWQRIARRMFAPEACATLEAMPPATRYEHFCMLWTAHEARIKWHGGKLLETPPAVSPEPLHAIPEPGFVAAICTRAGLASDALRCLLFEPAGG